MAKAKSVAAKREVAVATSVPTLVKVISVLYYISAALILLVGLGFTLGGSLAATFASVFENTGLAAIISGAIVAMGIGFIILSILIFFVARGLWTGKNWARIVAIVFAVLGVISALFQFSVGFAGGIVKLVISGLIAYYLIFSKEVKAAFK